MSRVKVRSEVLVYEISGKEVSSPHAKEAVTLIVRSDRAGRVVLQLNNGSDVSYTVVASDLEAAIRNAINTGGH